GAFDALPGGGVAGAVGAGGVGGGAGGGRAHPLAGIAQRRHLGDEGSVGVGGLVVEGDAVLDVAHRVLDGEDARRVADVGDAVGVPSRRVAGGGGALGRGGEFVDRHRARAGAGHDVDDEEVARRHHLV